MCRVVYAWASRAGAARLASLLRGLASAARRDPLLEEAYGHTSHCDGHGYVLAAREADSWSLDYYKFDACPGSGCGEAHCRENLDALEDTAEGLIDRLSSAEEAVLVLHARKASPGAPRGTWNAHPFHAHPADGSIEVYLAHNGSVGKEPLARELGVDPEGYTDSHLLALWLAARLGRGTSLAAALRGAEAYTRTALVLGLLVHSPGALEASAYAYLRPGLEDRLKAYYEPLAAEAPGLRAVVSPTVALRAGDPRISYRPAPRLMELARWGEARARRLR